MNRLLSLALFALPAAAFAATGSPALPAAAPNKPVAAQAQPKAAEFGAYVAISEGKVAVLLGGETQWRPAQPGQRLTPGTQVRTFEGSSVTLAMSDGSKIRLGAMANFKLEEVSPRAITGNLLLGKLEAWVSKYKRRKFTMRNPVAVASVRGTVFNMNVFSIARVEFNLFTGVLSITDIFGRTVNLTPGLALGATSTGGSGTPEPTKESAPAEPTVNLPQIGGTPDGSDAGGEEASGEEPSGEESTDETSTEETAAEDTTQQETLGDPNPNQDTNALSPSAP